MSNQVSLRFTVIVGVLLALALASFAAPVQWTAADRDEGVLRPTLTRGSGALDEDYTQFRYLKTTDYGQTWTAFTQAGDITGVVETTSSFGDFSAMVTDGNEICFVAVLDGDVYTVTGPTFTPVLAIESGTNAFDGNGDGWCDIARAPNGDLLIITWGHDSNGANTVWAAKSTDDGATWGTAWVVLTEPTLSADAKYFHLADLASATYAFMQFQIPGTTGHDQYVARVPLAGTAASITSLNDYAGSEFNYYTGNCKPIAFDPTNSVLYACYRAADLTGVAVHYSGDEGATFSPASVTAAQRYPSMALNSATETPWIISNFGVPAAAGEHCAWYSYDEFGYNGGSWTEATELSCTPFDGGDLFLFYMNQVYWWDADRGVAQLGLWGLGTPDGCEASYTSDGGATWADHQRIYFYEDDEIIANTVQNFELCGGTNGVAYIISSGMTGLTDGVAPTITQMELLSPATDPDGPYVVRAFYDDNVGVKVDDPDNAGPWINWGATSGSTLAFVNQDSAQLTAPERNAGWYYFTIPDTAFGGFGQGDSIFFYCDGYDIGGTYGNSEEQLIVAGVGWFYDTPERVDSRPADFHLLGNYPNPFNPSTRIEFTVPFTTSINLKVYNTLGQEVAVLADNVRVDAGLYAYRFDASDLPSGVYVYRLTAGSLSDAKKMILVK